MASTRGRVWITGASSGLGSVFAERFAGRGHSLALVARREPRLSALAEELTGRHGIDVEVVVADLSDAADLALVEARIRSDGELEVLINNAGACKWGSFASSDLDQEERFQRLLTTAPMRLCHAALPAMLGRGSGALLNISSRSAFAPQAMLAVYSASKAFVSAFTEALAQDVERRGVRCLAVCPGLIHTELLERAGIPPDGSGRGSTPGQVVDEALSDLDAGARVSVPGEPARDRWLRRCVPTSWLRRGAGVLRRLAR